MGLSISVFGGNRSESPNPNPVGRPGEEAKPYSAALRELQKDDDDNYVEALAGLCSPPLLDSYLVPGQCLKAVG